MGRAGVDQAVRVMVRVRPFNGAELAEHDASKGARPTSVIMMQAGDESVQVLDPSGCVVDSFEFSKVFWSIPESHGQYSSRAFSDQEDVYNETGCKAVEAAMNAHHCCIFAYGQTGSGKTFTMLGSEQMPGIAPRIVDEVFDSLAKQGWSKDGFQYSVEISFMEIYNEKVKDLLADVGGKASSPKRKKRDKDDDGKEDYRSLRVRNSPMVGVYIEGLKRLGKDKGVDSAAAVKKIMRSGMEHRATAETKMNSTSSRSHAVFQICIRSKNESKGISRYANINLVDLAGSEKVKMSKVEGRAFLEATQINQSLSTLRRVIDTLIENQINPKKKLVPPFRDSVLTWVLSETLGGNSVTMMMSNVSPAERNREDTINTLRYADKAKSIVNKVRKNEQRCNVMLGAMQQEMKNMREQLVTQQLTTQMGDALEENLGRTKQQAMEQKLANQRMEQEMLHVTLELGAAENEAVEIEAELAKLSEENVEAKHEAAKQEQQETVMALQKKHSLARIRAEENKKLSASLEAERQSRIELENQRAALAVRHAEFRQSLNSLKKRQFYTTFQRAFAMSSAKLRAQERAQLLRDVNETLSHASLESETISHEASLMRSRNSDMKMAIKRTNEKCEAMELKLAEDEVNMLGDIARRQEALEEAQKRVAGSNDEAALLAKQLLAVTKEAYNSAAEAVDVQKAVERRTEKQREILLEKKDSATSWKHQHTRLEDDLEGVEADIATLKAAVDGNHARAAQLRVELKLEKGLEDLMQAELVKTQDNLQKASWDVNGLRSKIETTAVVLDLLKNEHTELKQYVMDKFFKSNTLRQERGRALDRLGTENFDDNDRAWLGEGCAYMRPRHRTPSRSPSRDVTGSRRGSLSPRGPPEEPASNADVREEVVAEADQAAADSSPAAPASATPHAASPSPPRSVPTHVQDIMRRADSNASRTASKSPYRMHSKLIPKSQAFQKQSSLSPVPPRRVAAPPVSTPRTANGSASGKVPNGKVPAPAARTNGTAPATKVKKTKKAQAR
eukprot:TRINITY_DN5892_c1_g1_i1.p1 TRINITY_DN5892_c1_g1~~TRINITY_DN5892_c1_g1_i1.p1  ORF type:complete len:1019 (+),score=354.76 TRINITY_DN5892_c1_g1_i1:69-3125(+)